MKMQLLAPVAIMAATTAFGQGSVNFNNRVTSGSPGPVVAPVFGIDPADPMPKQGNPATYATSPIPTGTQTYSGAPLVGTGYTAQLWAANAALPDSAMVPISTTTFRVTTSASLMGFIQPPAGPAIVPGVAPGTSDRAKFQLRVWDNRGATITTWAGALSDTTVALGWSTIFVLDAPLAESTVSPPNLVGLESFQLFPIPEPSSLAFCYLAGLASFSAVWIQKQKRTSDARKWGR
jgi:hypothetical protein